LQPLEYTSEKMVLNVISYLRDLDVKFDDGFVIFGWDYNCKD